MGFLSTTWTSLRKIMGSSSEFQVLLSARYTRFSGATYEDLCTLLAEIEACLISRTCCALTDDLFYLNYLSPGHFLIGVPLTQLPAAGFTDVKCNRPSRFQIYKKNATVLATLVIQLPTDLQQHQRWQRTFPNLKQGDLVLLKVDNTNPSHWPKAVIKETHPGNMISSEWSHISTPREF